MCVSKTYEKKENLINLNVLFLFNCPLIKISQKVLRSIVYCSDTLENYEHEYYKILI